MDTNPTNVYLNVYSTGLVKNFSSLPLAIAEAAKSDNYLGRIHVIITPPYFDVKIK